MSAWRISYLGFLLFLLGSLSIVTISTHFLTHSLTHVFSLSLSVSLSLSLSIYLWQWGLSMHTVFKAFIACCLFLCLFPACVSSGTDLSPEDIPLSLPPRRDQGRLPAIVVGGDFHAHPGSNVARLDGDWSWRGFGTDGSFISDFSANASDDSKGEHQ